MEIQELYSIFRKCGSVTTDSRTIKGGELFFALTGENFDGNKFAMKALEQGASYAVVKEGSEAASLSDPRIIPVEDTLATLQTLATFHRRSVKPGGRRLPVIGLTGTNGKTTTKELIREVLSAKYRVVATEGNLNNDIGVPLSLLRIKDDTQIAVIEMGASHPDDIVKLVAVCEPDFGLITTVGKAHLLGFGSFEGVKAAKGALYDYLCGHDGTAFVNVDDAVLSEMASSRNGMSIVPYGLGYEEGMVLPTDEAHPFLRVAIPDGEPRDEEGGETLLAINTRLVGAYNAVNVDAALSVGRFFEVPLQDGIAAIEAYEPSNNRSMMQKTGRNTLIVDAYNANPTSMAAALDNFAAFSSDNKVALLGSMGELGEDSVKEHMALVGRLLGGRDGIAAAYLVGEEFRKALAGFGNSTTLRWFLTSEDLRKHLEENPGEIDGAVVLVKGSRSQQMEKVIPAL